MNNFTWYLIGIGYFIIVITNWKILWTYFIDWIDLEIIDKGGVEIWLEVLVENVILTLWINWILRFWFLGLLSFVINLSNF
jgi:hypothetical protein